MTVWETVLAEIRTLADSHDRLHAKLQQINSKLEAIMSEQSQVDADVQAIEGDIASIAAAVTAVQAEIASLQAANPAIDLTGLNQAVTDLANATSSVQGLEPPAAPVTPPATS